MSINLRDNSATTCLDLIRQEMPDLKALLDVYPEGAVEKLMANKDKLNKIVGAFKDMRHFADTNTLLMTCNSKECPHRSVCVLVANDMAPDTFPCPIEKKIVIELEGDLVQSLSIDRNDPIEMELLWDLIDTKLLDMRASGALKNGSVVQVVQQQVAKVTQTKEEASPSLLMKLDLKRLKHSIIDSFVATRRAKKKYGMATDINTIEALVVAAATRNRIEQNDG